MRGLGMHSRGIDIVPGELDWLRDASDGGGPLGLMTFDVGEDDVGGPYRRN